MLCPSVSLHFPKKWAHSICFVPSTIQAKPQASHFLFLMTLCAHPCLGAHRSSQGLSDHTETVLFAIRALRRTAFCCLQKNKTMIQACSTDQPQIASPYLPTLISKWGNWPSACGFSTCVSTHTFPRVRVRIVFPNGHKKLSHYPRVQESERKIPTVRNGVFMHYLTRTLLAKLVLFLYKS